MNTLNLTLQNLCRVPKFVPETLGFVSNRAVYTLWRRFTVCLCESQTYTSSQIVLCTHVGAGSGFACASLKPCNSSEIVLCTHFRASSGFVRAHLSSLPRLKSCCSHTLAPVQGLLVQASNLIPRLKSCCVHTFAPVQGLRVRVSNPVHRLQSCCVHTLAPVQGSASHRVPRIKSCCLHTFAPVQGLPVRASNLIQIVLCTQFGTPRRSFRHRHTPGVSPWISFATVLGVSVAHTFCRFFRRKHSPGASPLISLETGVQSVLGRTHFLQVLPSQTLSWSLSLDILDTVVQSGSVVHTFCRFIRRKHSLGASPWISLATVVLGGTHFLQVLPSQTLSWSFTLHFLGYCGPECFRSHRAYA